jgi:DNA modification methylase
VIWDRALLQKGLINATASEGHMASSSSEGGYLLEISPLQTFRKANVRQVKEGSVSLFLDSVNKEGYTRNAPPTVYEPDPAIAACDMSDAQRAAAKFHIRDGAHRICGIAKLMADPTREDYPDTYRIQVRVVPAASNDLECRQDAVTDNVVTDNRITKRTSCDELWALLGVRNFLIRDLMALSAEWVTACQLTSFTVANMPASKFPQLTQEEFDEFQKLMKKFVRKDESVPREKPQLRIPALDELIEEVTYVRACKFLRKYIPPNMPATAELNFIERQYGAGEVKEKTGGSLKSVKWSILAKMLPHEARLMEATDVLQVGGNGLVRVEGKDTRIWDSMCILNNIGDPTSELPGAIDIRSLQARFFTAEARRRPFLAVLYLNVVIRATKTTGGGAGKRHIFVQTLAEQTGLICYQYQRLAELLLGNGAPPHVHKTCSSALEELIGDYIVFSDTNYELEVLPCPSTSSGSALWTTPSAKWTWFAETELTSNKHPTHGTEWKDMSQQDQAIDRERRSLAQTLLSDLSSIPYKDIAMFVGTIDTTPASQDTGVADDSNARGSGRRRRGSRDRSRSATRSGSADTPTSEFQVSHHVFRTYLRMEQHKALEHLGALGNTPIARSHRSDAVSEGERSPQPPAKRARKSRADDGNEGAGEDDDDDNADMEDAPVVEKAVSPLAEASDDVETAKTAVRRHMEHTMKVVMLQESFEHFAQSDTSHGWNGRVSLVLTDPPYNTQRKSATARGRGSRRDMSHDKISEEQIRAAADLFERLLRPGGQCFIFCAFDQVETWIEALERAGGGASMVPDKCPEVISIKPTAGTPGSGFRWARSNCTEYAVHAYKRMDHIEKETQRQREQRYSRGVGFGSTAVSWKSGNTMPSFCAHLNNCVPPLGRQLLKEALASGEHRPLRTSQKSVPTLRDIIQLFAPHRDQVIFDPFAGTMSTVIAALAERNPVLACEQDKECFELAIKRVYEYGYGMAARNEITVTDAQRASLRSRTPGPEAVDSFLEADEDARGAPEDRGD